MEFGSTKCVKVSCGALPIDTNRLQEGWYRRAEISCNIYNPGGTATGYWGPFVKGPVLLGGFQLDADYSIMAQDAFSARSCGEFWDGLVNRRPGAGLPLGVVSVCKWPRS